MTQGTFGYLQNRLFTVYVRTIHTYRHTDTDSVLHVYVGLAQARPKYSREIRKGMNTGIIMTNAWPQPGLPEKKEWFQGERFDQS